MRWCLLLLVFFVGPTRASADELRWGHLMLVVSTPVDSVLWFEALDLEGRAVEEDQSGYVARIWQHETDHLNGTLLLDRMGTVARLASKRTLAELRSKYEEQNPPPTGKKPKR